MKRTSERVEFWRQSVAQQERSCQSVKAFCEVRGLTEPTFYVWRKRFRRDVPAKFALVDTNCSQVRVELTLTTGERLQIPCEVSALRVVLGGGSGDFDGWGELRLQFTGPVDFDFRGGFGGSIVYNYRTNNDNNASLAIFRDFLDRRFRICNPHGAHADATAKTRQRWTVWRNWLRAR